MVCRANDLCFNTNTDNKWDLRLAQASHQPHPLQARVTVLADNDVIMHRSPLGWLCTTISSSPTKLKTKDLRWCIKPVRSAIGGGRLCSNGIIPLPHAHLC